MHPSLPVPGGAGGSNVHCSGVNGHGLPNDRVIKTVPKERKGKQSMHEHEFLKDFFSPNNFAIGQLTDFYFVQIIRNNS